MKFIWEMTEENWKNMMHDMNASGNDELSKDYDFYGQMYVGDYCVEFIIADGSEDGYYAFTNIYQLFIDNGYGYLMTNNKYTTTNKTPYDLISGYIDVPKANDFKEFKKLCEKEFISEIGVCFWKEFADKKCEWLV